jgi:general secretion pathway protein L
MVRRRGAITELAALPPGTAPLAAAVKAQLSRAEQQGLTLRFAAGRAIVQRLLLPAGARPVLAAVLKNKIEGLAPWPLEDCAWGYALEPEEGATLPVSLGILGRKALQSYLSALAAVGVKPAEVDIDGGAQAPAIVIDHNSEARRARVSAVVKLLAGVAAAAIAGIGLYGGYLAALDYGEWARIEARNAELTRTLTARPEGGNLPPQQAAANRLAERKQAERPFVLVLNDLTRAIPDTSWLTALDLADGQVTVQGRGGPAPEVLQSLEAAEAFARVNFAAATQHDEQAGTDVFAIAATVEPRTAAP